MFPAFSTVLVEIIDETIVRVSLNRPEAANALNTQAGEDLAQVFRIIRDNARQYRAVILTGMGKTFCAGADLKERKGMDENQWHHQHRALENAVSGILSCPLPVIAAVRGAAYGGGMELALACDFIYATAHAKFACPEVTLGIMPGMGGTQQLPRALGTRRASELLFTGRSFTATEAYEACMVNRLCEPDALLDETLETARAIGSAAPLAVKAVKQSIREGMAMPLKTGMENELNHYRTLLNTLDRQEGVNAFNEKRKPSFTGE